MIVEKLKKFLTSSLAQDIVVPLVMVFLLIILTNPLGLFLSPILIGIIVFILVLNFTFSIWFDRRRGSFPDRAALMAVATVLLAGIVIQSLLNVLDVWLALALAAMIGAKVWGKVARP